MREAMTTQRLSGLSRPPKGRKNSSGMINWLALCSYMRQPPDKKFVDYYSKLLCTSFRTKEAETFYLQGFSIYSVDPNYVELSNGTVPIANKEKAEYITEFVTEFTVLSEVGKKDVSTSNEEDSSAWREYIQQDFEAGASKVILEARESGTSGICRENGSIRMDIFDLILDAQLPIEKLIFEAPTKKMQTFFNKKLEANVNLGNIALQDVLSVETVRLG